MLKCHAEAWLLRASHLNWALSLFRRVGWKLKSREAESIKAL